MITIVSGGTRGLGAAVARKLVGDGQSTGLVLVGRSVERGKALAGELTGLGTQTVFIPAEPPSSTSGHGGQPRLTAYSMSKGALSVMTKNLAYALMRHNIPVNQVNPGWMETESEHHTQMTQDGAPENWLELAAPTRPFRRLVQPWEAANLIAFCLSPESGLLTGNVIDIDQTVQGAGEQPLPSSEETPQP